MKKGKRTNKTILQRQKKIGETSIPDFKTY